MAWALASVPFAAPAQQAPPSGGQLLQQVQPPATRPTPRAPALTLPSPATTAATDTTPIAVRRIVIGGNTALPTAMLHALVAGDEGRTLTLAQLQASAQRITDAYRAHGYLLARALVPAQTLTDGTVRIQVIEARYDQVRVINHSRVRDGLLQAMVGGLHPGDRVAQAALDRPLLLIGDLPGVRSRATLGPGTEVGTSDLTVEAVPAAPVIGHVGVDDAGNRYTGRARVNAGLAVNNLLGLGDRLSVDALTSGRDLRYGRLAYALAVNGAGTRVGAAYSALDYRLGQSLADLKGHGTAQGGSAWLTQPFVRRANANLSGRLEVDQRRLHDHLDSTHLHDDRHTLDWTASVLGDWRDDRGGGGITTATLGVTRGQLGFDDAQAAAADAATAQTQGHYTRWNAGLSRLQTLTASTRLYLALDGQYSTRNLDSSEQFLLGGLGSVRGYATSALAGASGYLATVELRHDLTLPWAGQWQGAVFVDGGGLWVNAQSWAASTGSNHATLTSAGLGLEWAGPAQWMAKLQVAAPVGNTPALAGRQPSTQLWLQVSKSF